MRASLTAIAVLLAWTAPSSASASLPSEIWKQTRRWTNLGSLFGNPRRCAATPYDRLMGNPVFQVTTTTGNTYLTLSSHWLDKNVMTPNPEQAEKLRIFNDEEGLQGYYTVSVYYMDPDDALTAHAELQQLDQLRNTEVKITTTSMAKALRTSSNLDDGLLTGQPINPLTGNLLTVEDGGSLRHKLCPSPRQFFYAARCIGKERVGLMDTDPVQDAKKTTSRNAVDKMMIKRNLQISSLQGKKTPAQEESAHMDGKVGIPVFWAHGMQRQLPLLKRWLSGNREETPLFMNYEDLIDAWEVIKKRQSKSSEFPDQPTVEVFNLWDVLTSMEKDAWRTSKQALRWKNLIQPLQQRFGPRQQPDLDSITFVPCSRSVQFKATVCESGNGKPRLRPMRNFR